MWLKIVLSFSVPLVVCQETTPRPIVADQQTTTSSPRKLIEIPKNILNELPINFKKLKPNMNGTEVFRTLGLNKYEKQLREFSRIQLDGAGGNWRMFLDDYQGYSFAFRDFLGSKAKCYIRCPGDEYWRSKETNAKPIDFSKLDRNRYFKSSR